MLLTAIASYSMECRLVAEGFDHHLELSAVNKIFICWSPCHFRISGKKFLKETFGADFTDIVKGPIVASTRREIRSLICPRPTPGHISIRVLQRQILLNSKF